jgi:hypothetical protein
MRSVLAVVTVASLALPVSAAITFDGSFNITPGNGGAGGLIGTVRLDENQHLTFSLDQNGTAVDTTNTDLSKYLAAYRSAHGTGHLYPKIVASALEAALTDPTTSAAIQSFIDAVKTALQSRLQGSGTVDLAPVLDAAKTAFGDIADIVLQDISKNLPNGGTNQTALADVIRQFEKQGTTAASLATELTNRLNPVQPLTYASGASPDAMLLSAPVPEPASLALLTIGGLILLRRRVA